MAEGDKIDMGKWFASFFQAIPWLKDLRTYVGLAIIIVVGVTIWRAYFLKNQTQTQNQRMVVYPLSFSHISNITFESPQQQQKMETKKKAWFLPTVFGELYGFAEKATVGNDRTGVGVRGGLRWDLF